MLINYGRINSMELRSRNNLEKKLNLLSEEELELVSNFIDELDVNQDSLQGEETPEIPSQLMKKWKYLLENDEELDPLNPLSNREIETICQILSKENKTRPTGFAKGEFTIGDDFNDALPDEIVDEFYQ